MISVDLGNFNYSENCFFMLVGEKEHKKLKSELEKLTDEMKEKIKELVTIDKDGGVSFHKFITKKRNDLVKNKIVLFNFCYLL